MIGSARQLRLASNFLTDKIQGQAMARGPGVRLLWKRGFMSENTLKKPGPQLVTKERERWLREESLDRTLADSFPSSDPPSSIPDPLAEDPYAA